MSHVLTLRIPLLLRTRTAFFFSCIIRRTSIHIHFTGRENDTSASKSASDPSARLPSLPTP